MHTTCTWFCTTQVASAAAEALVSHDHGSQDWAPDGQLHFVHVEVVRWCCVVDQPTVSYSSLVATAQTRISAEMWLLCRQRICSDFEARNRHRGAIYAPFTTGDNAHQFQVQRSRSPARLMLRPEVRHIFWTERETWYTYGVRRPVSLTSSMTTKVKVGMSRGASDRCP